MQVFMKLKSCLYIYIFVIIRAAVVMVNVSFPLREERIIIGDSLFAIKIALHKKTFVLSHLINYYGF